MWSWEIHHCCNRKPIVGFPVPCFMAKATWLVVKPPTCLPTKPQFVFVKSQCFAGQSSLINHGQNYHISWVFPGSIMLNPQKSHKINPCFLRFCRLHGYIYICIYIYIYGYSNYMEHGFIYQRRWSFGITWIHLILVGGWPTPLKNMISSVGMMTFTIWWEKNKCSKPPTKYCSYTLTAIDCYLLKHFLYFVLITCYIFISHVLSFEFLSYILIQ